ncbi:MAG: hypothetical protein H6900_00555 [Rhodobacter sp.]|uniref:hypothetical protein n=1 Tax=Pararhodobacter sp. TaxID=2127056 RepID=UPI001DDF0F06|nr:hypothetical protein [Pararhodobacter sp.]MCB1343987.1 hypothetical protein [Paracoccaceae bacterium]MCC0071756.1 hypothetical protein [Rhodobacter sp.]HPD93250.1 hypothetical protein [Pararhodobacter sp.]
MAGFLRPQARAALARWAETGIALAVTGLGAWWAWTGLGLLRWGAIALAVIGAALTFGAVQRARFHRPGQAPGLVELDEGEVRYLGPRGGGVLALDRMASLSISADRRFWLAESLDGGILAVPCTAQGSEVLFDAFSTLPGLDMERLLRLAAQPPGERAQTIWQRRALHLLT